MTEPDYSKRSPRHAAPPGNPVRGVVTSNSNAGNHSRRVSPPQVTHGAHQAARQYQAGYAGYQRSSYAPAPAPTRPTAQQLYPKQIKKRKRKRIFKRIGLSALALLLVAVFATGGYALWYSSALNSALSMGAEQAASVEGALTVGKAGEPFNMLVLGSDSREGSGTSAKAAESGDNQRSDVMILLRVDASHRKMTMVSIPRDTPYVLDNGTTVKINEVYNLEGAAGSIKAVSKVTGAPISHYAEIHFSELQQMVDKLGGVTVDVDVALSYKDALTGETVTLEPGTQKLTGQQAQIFARARHEYVNDQDEHRQNNVRSLAFAILKEVLNRPINELPGVVLDLAAYVGTDMNTADIVSLALGFAGGSEKMVVYSATGPSIGGISDGNGGLWLCYENPEGWANLMSVVNAGDDPKDVDVNATAIIPGAGAEATHEESMPNAA